MSLQTRRGGGIHRSPANPIAPHPEGTMRRPPAGGSLAAMADDTPLRSSPPTRSSTATRWCTTCGEVGRIARHGLGRACRPRRSTRSGTRRALAGPDEKFVSINNDTLYSIANVDASGGPVRLDVPDSAGRYYVLQFVDAWTNNFAYVGHRATGTAARAFLLVPPGWDGDAPADATVIRLPTAVASIVGRWAVDGEADIPAVHALQDGLRLTPTAPGAGLPVPGAGAHEDLRVLRAAARADAGLPAGRAGPCVPGPVRAARPARARVAVPHARPRPARGARRGAGRRAGSAWRRR